MTLKLVVQIYFFCETPLVILLYKLKGKCEFCTWNFVQVENMWILICFKYFFSYILRDKVVKIWIIRFQYQEKLMSPLCIYLPCSQEVLAFVQKDTWFAPKLNRYPCIPVRPQAICIVFCIPSPNRIWTRFPPYQCDSFVVLSWLAPVHVDFQSKVTKIMWGMFCFLLVTFRVCYILQGMAGCLK